MKRINFVSKALIACCALHNICLKFNNNQWMEDLIANEQPNIGDETTNTQNIIIIKNTLSGCMKRDQIMIILNH